MTGSRGDAQSPRGSFSDQPGPSITFQPPNEVDEEPWRKHIILTLDGGGIRGYWSLLVLENLMKIIADEEERINVSEDIENHHSFNPQSWPQNVSQIQLNDTQKTATARASNDEERIRIIPKERRYLPCHYFDHICGSSTGALIAIMLGRFRMTVSDCKREYEVLGHKVFGKPRMIHFQRIPFGDRHKYDAADIEKVFRDFARRRNDLSAGDFEKVRFPSGKGLCSTLVTSRVVVRERSDDPYLLRSYDHKRRAPTEKQRVESTFPSRQSTNITISRPQEHVNSWDKIHSNYGCAQDFEIWQVARAATAAMLFFKPLKVRFENKVEDSYVEFTDGGFGRYNNPVIAAKSEVERLYGESSVGIIVSVGTARSGAGQQNQQDPQRKHFWTSEKRRVKQLADLATDPEENHITIMQELAKDEKYDYYRLNRPGLLDADLDEWEPKKTKSSSAEQTGHLTLEKIQQAFYEYASDSDVQRKMANCANALVNARRARAHTPRWERFATGANYECREIGCDFQTYFGQEFRAHLMLAHPVLTNKIEDKAKLARECWVYKAAS